MRRPIKWSYFHIMLITITLTHTLLLLMTELNLINAYYSINIAIPRKFALIGSQPLWKSTGSPTHYNRLKTYYKATAKT
jgi:hypothetical protein